MTKWKTVSQRNKTVRHLLHEIKNIPEDRCEKCKRHISFCERRMLHIHHIDTNDNNNDSANLRILCSPCHLKAHRNQNHYKRIQTCGFCGKEFESFCEHDFCSKECGFNSTKNKLDKSMEIYERTKNIIRKKEAGIEGKVTRCLFCGGSIYSGTNHFCYLKKKDHFELVERKRKWEKTKAVAIKEKWDAEPIRDKKE